MATANFDSHTVWAIVSTAQNHYDIYRLLEWLEGAMAKKIRRGQVMDVHHLAGCSTMRRLVRLAIKLGEIEGVTSADRREASIQLAQSCIEDAEYLATA